MTDTILTQVDADILMEMEKHRLNSAEWDYPALGGQITIPLVSSDRREQFLLDLRRGTIRCSKGTYQNRGRQVAILARLDFGGAPHLNPDGEKVGSPHLHLYLEGFGDKWAYPVPPDAFPNLQDPWLTLQDFMHFCNITEPPFFKKELLS